MSVSRRWALAGATAFVATGGSAPFGLAAQPKAAPQRRGRPTAPGAQRFLELLIHHDEAKHTPYKAELAIPSGDTAWYAVDTLDVTKFRSTNEAYRKRGYRLKRISVFKTRQGVRYSACWQFAKGPDWHVVHGMTRASFDEKTASYMRNGYRMAHLDARARYAAIWEKSDAVDQKIFSALGADEFEQRCGELSAQGYRPIRLSGGVADGAEHYAALFEPAGGTPWQARHRMDAQALRKAVAEMTRQGYRLVDASGHVQNGKPSFTGIWEQV